MMKMKFPLIAVFGILAATLACGGDKSPSPAAPSPAAAATGDAAAAADGSTLKVPPPTLVSPANGTTLQDFQVVLRLNPVTGKFVNVSNFAYRFQVMLDGQVVAEHWTPSTQYAPPDLANNVTYGWRARAEDGLYVGPWSDTWTFKTPDIPEGYITGGELYDPLTNGKTVGIVHGSVTFIPKVGARINDLGSYIEYHLHQTVTNGQLSLLVTGMPTNTEGGKTKIMAMSEGGSDITTNDRRFTIEKRGDPAGMIAWRVITRDDQIDTSGPERRVVNFDPNKVYLFQAEWGANHFNLLIKQGGTGGTTIYNFGKHYAGVYDPNPHYAYAGGPGGRGGLNNGSVTPMIVRQVWLSARDRPPFADK